MEFERGNKTRGKVLDREEELYIEYTIHNTCWYCNHSTLPVAVEEKCCPVFLQVWVGPKSM